MKKLLSIVLTAVCVLSLVTGGALAAKQSSVDTQINSAAESYLFALAENMWLYKSNDLSVGTIKEVLASNELSPARLVSDGLKMEEINTYLEDITFAQEKAEYFKEMRQEQNIQRNDFKAEYFFVPPEVDGNHATTFAVEHISFHYPNFPDVLSEATNYYTIELMKLENEWVVVGVEAENDEFDEAFKGTGFVAENADSFFAAHEKNIASQEEAIDALMNQYGFIDENQMDDSQRQPLAASNSVWYPYNANNATAYAYTYVSQMFGKTDWDKISTADKNIGKTFYNANFKEFAGAGGDCQNFASQSIWAGFNGSNSPNQIYHASTGVYSPIMDSSGNFLWRGTVPDSSANSASWTACNGKPGVIGFRKYIAGEYDSGDPDMIVTKGTLTSSQDFTGIYRNLKGALLHVNGGGHAIIVTDVNGPSRSDVLFCGHTSDRKALSIADMHGNDSIYYFIPQKIRVQNPPEVKITSVLKRPLPTGTSALFSGNTDITCASIHIDVKSPSGVPYSNNATNARNVSRTVTLSETGLYTVTITAKKTATSTPVLYVYTVRTY